MPTIITQGAASARGFGFAGGPKGPPLPITASNYVGTINEWAYRGITFDRISGYWLYTQQQASTETIYRMSLTTSGTVTNQSSFTMTSPGPGIRGLAVHPTQNYIYSCSYGNPYLFIGNYSGGLSTVNLSQTGGSVITGSGWGLTYNSDQDRLVVGEFQIGPNAYWNNISSNPTPSTNSGTITFYKNTGSIIDVCGLAYDSDANVYYVSTYNGGNNIWVCNPDGSSYGPPIQIPGSPSVDTGIGALGYYNGILLAQPDENDRTPSNPLRMFYRAV